MEVTPTVVAGTTVGDVTADEVSGRRLARLHDDYARNVRHPRPAGTGDPRRADYLLARVRLEVGPQVTGWADELDVEAPCRPG